MWEHGTWKATPPHPTTKHKTPNPPEETQDEVVSEGSTIETNRYT